HAGAKVTILHRGMQPLEHFDPDLVSLLVQRSRDIGIDIHLQSTVKKLTSHQRVARIQYNTLMILPVPQIVTKKMQMHKFNAT
ncbi:MAG: NAD-binding protein, partial [Nitrososphaera sp.]